MRPLGRVLATPAVDKAIVFRNFQYWSVVSSYVLICHKSVALHSNTILNLKNMWCRSVLGPLLFAICTIQQSMRPSIKYDVLKGGLGGPRRCDSF